MTERELQDLLRNMRDEPVPADSLARVRMGVDQRLRKRSWWKLATFGSMSLPSRRRPRSDTRSASNSSSL